MYASFMMWCTPLMLQCCTKENWIPVMFVHLAVDGVIADCLSLVIDQFYGSLESLVINQIAVDRLVLTSLPCG